LSSPVSLIVLGILMVISAVVLLQAVPLLYTIAFPPTLAVPSGTTLIRHKQYEQGVDEWLYRAPIQACAVSEYLRTLGIECPSYTCGGLPPTQPEPYSGIVMQCYGQQSISMFKVQWTVMLNPDPADGTQAVFQVYREMFWGGQIPSKRFTDILEEVDMTTTAQYAQTPTAQP